MKTFKLCENSWKSCLQRERHFQSIKEIKNIKINLVCHLIWTSSQEYHSQGNKVRQITYCGRRNNPRSTSLPRKKTKQWVWSSFLEDKSNVKKVLFLLDKISDGNSFYQKLTMTINGLPKSYLVKQRQDQLHNICHITHIPGTREGAHTLFTDLEERWKDYLPSHPEGYEDTIWMKISGDGARMTPNSSFILMSFPLLDLGDDVMAAKGNHTIVLVKSKTLQESFADVFN